MNIKRNRFAKRSGMFFCRICGRGTRDTTGDNGETRLCEDCYEGCEQENGFMNESDPEVRAGYERGMTAAFQRAVDRGGVIDGYTPTKVQP